MTVYFVSNQQSVVKAKARVRKVTSPEFLTGNTEVGAITVTTSEDFPLANRLDLPEHERRISAQALAMLRAGVESARRGEIADLDPKWLADDEE